MHTTPPPVGTPGRGKKLRLGWIFTLCALAMFITAMDQTIAATALRAIQADLGTTLTWASWTVTVYSLGQVVVMPLAGKLSDLYGRKRIFLLAVAIFVVGAIGAGFSDNIATLLIFRAVQAMGGGAFMPAASGIVAEHFRGNRDRALGMFSTFFSFGAVTGPILGGFFVEYTGWRPIFWFSIPICILVLIVGAFVLPPSTVVATGRPDVLGILLLGASILSAMFAVTFLANSTASSLPAPVITAGAAAVVLTALFVIRMRMARAPFIPLNLLVGRHFLPINIINLFAGMAALGFSVLLPLYAALRFDEGGLAAGALLAARAIGTIAVATLATFALRRTGYRLPVIVGFLFCALSLFIAASVDESGNYYIWLLVVGALCGVGLGIMNPAANNVGIRLYPQSAAAIAGLRGMFRQGGSIASVSIVTSIAANTAAPGNAMANVFLVLGILMVVAAPLALLIPEHRGAW
jgi:EmrB/QacA subfamily drug resistance transporter